MERVATESLMQFNVKPANHMVRGRGSRLWDAEGRAYLDFVQAWAVNALGHSPSVLVDALKAQLDEVVHPGSAFHNRPSHRLAQRLAEVSGLPSVYLGCTGAEANETAVKLARRWGQKHRDGAYEVLTTIDSFHGRTFAMTSATGKPGFDSYRPSSPGFRKVPFGNVDAIANAIESETVAVMVEPVQGEAGAVVPPAGFLAALRTLCDERGILLILDEVQTGMARTGPMFAHQADGIRPDIMTLGKGLGGGLPVAAMLARAEVQSFALGDHGGTFIAHALLSAGALAVLETLLSAQHTATRVESARALEETLRAITEPRGLTLRGRGHLWGIVLPAAIAELVRDRCFDEGLLINAARPNVLRFMPALDVTRSEIDEMASTLSRVLDRTLTG